MKLQNSSRRQTGRHIAGRPGLALFAGGAAQAQISGNVVKIGVMSDMSGLYADIGGPGSVVAAKMAVEDYLKATKSSLKVEVVSADHQNKPDVGSSIARKWYETDGVDMIADVPTSSVALAVNQVTKDMGKAFVNTGAASSDLTGKDCSPNTVHWLYDTWMLAHGTGSAVVKAGGDSWFFLTADYAFGHALERDTSEVVKSSGGKVLGSVKVPLGTADFSSFLLQAQSSKAKIVGLANAGGDTINSIKQAAEFGIVKGGQKLAGLLVFLPDIHGLGLNTAQGLNITEAFYWDLNDQHARLEQALRGVAWRQIPVVRPRRRLRGRAALPEGGGRRQDRRRCQGGRQDEGAAHRRHAVRQGHGARRRSQDPPGVPVRGQEAQRVQGSLRLLQGGADHPGRAGVPSPERGQLPAGGQEVSARAARHRQPWKSSASRSRP
jgi:ABC-type branched-subunit amino acid transport system substrate-binding protein